MCCPFLVPEIHQWRVLEWGTSKFGYVGPCHGTNSPATGLIRFLRRPHRGTPYTAVASSGLRLPLLRAPPNPPTSSRYIPSVCVCAYIYVYMYMAMYAYIYIHIHIHLLRHKQLLFRYHVCIYSRYFCIHDIHVYTYIDICIYTNISVCMHRPEATWKPQMFTIHGTWTL